MAANKSIQSEMLGHVNFAGYPPSELWPALMHAIGDELCEMGDLVDSWGKASSAHVGRARGVRVVKKTALPSRTSAALGKVDARSHTLKWLAIRVKKLAEMSPKLREGSTATAGTARQCDNAMAKITARSGLAATVRKISDEWEQMIDIVGEHTPGHDTELLRNIARSAEEDASERKKIHATARADFVAQPRCQTIAEWRGSESPIGKTGRFSSSHFGLSRGRGAPNGVAASNSRP